MAHKSILLVEDHQDDVDLTLRALHKNRIMNDVAIARDGEEALRYLFGTGSSGEDLPPLPAVMLLDLNLPKVDGLHVLQQVRAHPRTKLLPVVILTSSKEEQDLIQSELQHGRQQLCAEAGGLPRIRGRGSTARTLLVDPQRDASLDKGSP